MLNNWEQDVRFDEETHTYYYKENVVASVSQILSATIFKNKYGNVPEHILQKAAEFGSNVHKAIETMFPYTLTDEEYSVYLKYVDIKERYNLEVLEQEEMIFHPELNYMGRFDMTGLINGCKSLIDIKTTYSLDKEYLSWQLSMYYWGKKDDSIKKLYVIWLPKRKGPEVVEIPLKSHEEIEWLISLYKESL